MESKTRKLSSRTFSINQGQGLLWERYEQKLSEMAAQYQNLYTQNLELQGKLEQVYQESLILKQEREEKPLRRIKKSSAKKQTLRDTVDLPEFEQIVTLVKERNKAKERTPFALALLYIYGLRVSNLLLFSVSNGKELFEKRNTSIQLIKRDENRFPLRLSFKGRNLLLRFKDKFVARCPLPFQQIREQINPFSRPPLIQIMLLQEKPSTKSLTRC